MTAVYNEIEPYAVEWLRALIAAGHINPGRVLSQSIVDLVPQDLDGAQQFHAFAGIGVWSHALRLAGWPDDVPIWTGSCPCQPFSSAGRKRGLADDRHLFPVWFELARAVRPAVIVGEQVSSKDALAWLDVVFDQLEGEGYSCRAIDTCAAGVGAAHIRQRLYWVAVAGGERLEGVRLQLRERRSGPGMSEALGLADGDGERLGAHDRDLRTRPEQPDAVGRGEACGVGNAGDHDWPGRLAEPHRRAPEQPDRSGLFLGLGNAGGGGGGRDAGSVPRAQAEGPRPGYEYRHLPHELVPPGTTRGHWSAADWLLCRDGKARPVEPLALQMAHGIAGGVGPLCTGVLARTGRLRGYGNAIVAQVAATFIQAVMDSLLEVV